MNIGKNKINLEQKYPNIITLGGMAVKPYLIIKEGFSRSLRALTEGGEGGQKSEKLPYVIYERPLMINIKLDSQFYKDFEFLASKLESSWLHTWSRKEFFESKCKKKKP